MTRTTAFLFAAALVVSPLAVAQSQTAAPPMPALTKALPISGTYALDPTHSQVRATWNHMGLSRPGVTFEMVGGTILLDAARPERSSVSVTIPISGLDTGVAELDRDFLSAKFFDVANHPQATFVSRSVSLTGLGNSFDVEGDLTVRGVTRPVTLHAVLNGSGIHPMTSRPTIGISATASVKRSDFGLDAFVPLVSDTIDLFITAEASVPTAK